MTEIQSTTFIFGLRRSGHHAITKWLRQCHEAAGISTSHIDDAYCGHLRYGENEKPRIVTPKEALALQAGTLTTFVSVEDYPYAQRRTLPLYDKLGPQNNDVITLRDWPNIVASRLGLIERDGAKGLPTLVDRLPWDGVADLWTEYAKSIVSGNENHINYNRWMAEPGYHYEVASRYGLSSNESYKQSVPQNGGGSSFQGLAFDGKGSEMNTLARWNNLPPHLVPHFLDILSTYPEADRLSGEIFGIGREVAIADLAMR